MGRWVSSRWPDRFQADPLTYLNTAGLVARKSGGDRGVRFTTRNEYEQKPTPWISVSCIQDLSEGNFGPVLAAVARLPPSAVGNRPLDPQVVAEVRRLIDRPDRSIANLVDASELLVQCVPDAELLSYLAQSLLPSLRASLEAPWVAVIRLAPEFHSRQAVIRGLLTANEAPEWLSDDKPAFESMKGLFGGLWHGRTVLLDPLLASQFPWLPGAAVARLGSGLLVLGYGAWLGYKDNLLDDDLSGCFRVHLLSDGLREKAPATPTLPAKSFRVAFEWWVQQTSRLVDIVLDPTLFASGEVYRPDLHYGFLHAVERMFASAVRLLTLTGLDDYSRRIHLFEVLDLLEGLGLGGYDVTLDADRLAMDIERLEKDMPPEAADLLLGRCKRAVEALRTVQQGFAPTSVSESGVALPKGVAPPPKAVAQVLRQMRNGSHGMLKDLEDPAKRRILALHDGDVPDDVSDVAFLHLLRLVSRPDILEAPRLRQLGPPRTRPAS
jgi:hypothetical protein